MINSYIKLKGKTTTMKNFIMALPFTLMLMIVSSCSVLDKVEEDPIATGEIIGFTYLLTKDELSTENREIVEKAYGLFSDIVSDEYVHMTNDTLKNALFERLDRLYPDADDVAKRTAIKLMANRYWNKLDAKYNISSLIPDDQLDMLRQVRIGIEQGLGR